MKKILIVEDDSELSKELKLLLEQNGYQAEAVTDFSNTKQQILQSNSDLVLLDINIPNENGEYLLKEIRKVNNVPIIMVTSRNTELDEVLSMSYGADDYITKPYNKFKHTVHV
ncbi:MAG TPA: response regulator [Candidatus Scybalousia intestinigallinarum]|nr:response regulator [Candidatus Scybalousia intestinigallinarum]